MSTRIKERILWLVVLMIVGLHIDLWGWNRIEPLLAGWIPYHLWYHGLLTLFVAVCMLWLALRIWPDPPADLISKEDTEKSS